MDRVVRNREAAEVTSDNFWLLDKGSSPWLFWLPAFLLFWLLVLAVLKDTPDMGEANMSAVNLTGELTGERNCSAILALEKFSANTDSSLLTQLLDTCTLQSYIGETKKMMYSWHVHLDSKFCIERKYFNQFRY